MGILKIVLDFYINSSIHVALAVYALTWVTLNNFGISYDENILYFNFYATITGYNFVKYFGLAKFHHRGLASWLKTIQIFSLICFFLLCFYAMKLEFKTMLWIGVFGLMTFLYAIPFLPKHLFLDKQQNLRSVSGLKIYVIALVWSGVTVLLPVLNNDMALNADISLTAIQRFLFVIVLLLPFEIRDMKYEEWLNSLSSSEDVAQRRMSNVHFLLDSLQRVMSMEQVGLDEAIARSLERSIVPFMPITDISTAITIMSMPAGAPLCRIM